MWLSRAACTSWRASHALSTERLSAMYCFFGRIPILVCSSFRLRSNAELASWYSRPKRALSSQGIAVITRSVLSAVRQRFPHPPASFSRRPGSRPRQNSGSIAKQGASMYHRTMAQLAPAPLAMGHQMEPKIPATATAAGATKVNPKDTVTGSELQSSLR